MNDPVLIAGAGPVGLMLACELGLANVPAVVLERLGQPNERSFGIAINAAVIELLSQRGVMDMLRGDGFEFPMAHFAHLHLDPTKLNGRHPYNFAVPHAKVQQRLEQRATDLGVEIRRGAEVTSLEQDETGVLVGVQGESGPAFIRGSYLVGCDGAQSAVRELAGIDFPGTDFAFSGLTGDIAVEQGDPLLGLLGPHQHDTGLFTVAPVGPGLLRVTTGEFGGQPEDREAPVTLADLRASAARIAGFTLTTGQLRWLSRWHAATRVADRYRAGRVFLAGDAAHVCFPLGGQALSTGIEDAANLGWKLAADLDGWAPAGLLDTYDSERHPVAIRVGLTTRAQTALMHSMDTAGPLREVLTELIQFEEVNAALVTMVGGVDVRYPAGSQSHPLAGCRLPDVPLRVADGSTSMARLLMTGRGLLLDFSGDDELADLAGNWAGRVDVVAADPAPDIDAAAVLVRPDGRVAWAAGAGVPAQDAGGLTAALSAWFGEQRAQAFSPA